MTLPHDGSSHLQLVAQYHAVISKLIALAERERTHLERGHGPLPLALVTRKEALVEQFVGLSAAVRARVDAIRAAGVTDTAALEQRIRHLVAVMKDNQRKLNAVKIRTSDRVEMVMSALAEQEAEEVAKVSATKLAAGGLSLRPSLRT